MLADLTPHGRERIDLQIGDRVIVEGEMKPSELKVHRLSRNGEEAIELDHKKREGHPPEGDADIATKAATAAGFETLGVPRRKPKHFEVLARHNGQLSELHIEFDGHIRKVKTDVDQVKWADTVRDL